MSINAKLTVAELRRLVADLVAWAANLKSPPTDLPSDLRDRVARAMPKKSGRPKTGGAGRRAAMVSLALRNMAGMPAGDADRRAAVLAGISERHVQGNLKNIPTKDKLDARLLLSPLDACDRIGADPMDGIETVSLDGLSPEQVAAVASLRAAKKAWAEVLEDEPDADDRGAAEQLDKANSDGTEAKSNENNRR